MENLKTTFSLKIEVLSPVHIGDGTKLEQSVDFVTYPDVGGTFVLDGVKFIDWAFPDEDAIDANLMNSNPGNLLAGVDPTTVDVWRYRMAGEPEKAEITSHIKDVYGRVYIPGSTLKGMLRTAFVRGLYITSNRRPDLNRLSRNRKWVGQSVERDVMGRNPNYDLFRALHISDTAAQASDVLQVASTSIYPTGQRNKEGAITAVEAIREQTIFESRLTIDEYGFRGRAATMLDWKHRRRQIDTILIPALQDFARVRILQEREYYRGRDDVRIVARFYRELTERYKTLEENQFLAQIGWGASWNSKTLNDLLLEDEEQFASLVHQYRLKARQSRGFKPDDEFPSSRNILRHGGRLVRPMGWILVTVGD